MTIQRYLGQIRHIDSLVENKIADIVHLRSLAYGTAVRMDSERVQTSPEMDRIGTVVATIADKEKEIGMLLRKRETIIHEIEKVEDIECYQVLMDLYVHGKTCKELDSEKRSKNYGSRMHRKAIKMLEDARSGQECL